MSVIRSKIPVRLTVDAAMAAGFVMSLGFRLTGGGPHEYIGLGVCVLFVLHCLLNVHWFTTWNTGRYDCRRALSSTLNVLLIICMVLLCLTGLMNSRHLLGFLQHEGGMTVRQVHSFAAYWGMVLVGVHAGIHWQKVMAASRSVMRDIMRDIVRDIKGDTMRDTKGDIMGSTMRDTIRDTMGSTVRDTMGSTVRDTLRDTMGAHPSTARARCLRLLALLLAVYGAWAFTDRDMGAKLFLGFAFDFWDPAQPSILFYTHTLAIISLYACCAHYGLKLLRCAFSVSVARRVPDS